MIKRRRRDWLLFCVEYLLTGPGTAWRLWRGGYGLRFGISMAWLSLVAYERRPFDGPGRWQRLGRWVFRLKGEHDG